MNDNSKPLTLRELAMTHVPTSEGDRRSIDWLKKAIVEFDRCRSQERGSTWLPSTVDVDSSCPGSGTYGECRDPHCSAPGVVAQGHDRKRRGSDSQAVRAPHDESGRTASQPEAIEGDAA
jgi:hypothetical protein